MPDTTTYPGSDYYEIAVVQYRQKLQPRPARHPLRGYVQLNRGTDASGRTTVEPAPIHYLGPLIEARRAAPCASSSSTSCRPARAASSSCPWTPRSPARAPVRSAATRCIRRTGRRCTCRAGSRRGSAAAGGLPVGGAGARTLALRRRPQPRLCAGHVVRCPGRPGLRGYARGHQRPGPGHHDALLPQRPERPLPLPARRHLRPHAPQRVRGRGGAVHHRRPRGRRTRRRQCREAGGEQGDRRDGRGRYGPGRRVAAHHRGQDVRARPRAARGADRPGTWRTGEGWARCRTPTSTCRTRTPAAGPSTGRSPA